MKEITEDRTWSLITKYLGNELDKSEQEEFNQWVNSDKLHQFEVAKAVEIWKITGKITRHSFNSEAGWNIVKSYMHSKRIGDSDLIFWKSPLIRIAAIVILVLSATLLVRNIILKDSGRIIIAETQKLNIPVVLPDGSEVFLNSHSRIEFQKGFAHDRKVKLWGEAYFNVTHNPRKPFEILTRNTMIRVLGTSFNVQSCQDSIKVIVENGTVEFFSSQTLNKMVLIRGNTGVYYLNSNKMNKLDTFDINNLSWKTNRMIFKNASLGYVFQSLKNRFSKNFVFNNENLKSYKLTATYIDVDLDNILAAIQIAHNLQIIREKNTYYISGPIIAPVP